MRSLSPSLLVFSISGCSPPQQLCSRFKPVLTGFAGVRQTGTVSLSVDGHHGDGVAGVWSKLSQDRFGGALGNHLLETHHIFSFNLDFCTTFCAATAENEKETLVKV